MNWFKKIKKEKDGNEKREKRNSELPKFDDIMKFSTSPYDTEKDVRFDTGNIDTEIDTDSKYDDYKYYKYNYEKDYDYYGGYGRISYWETAKGIGWELRNGYTKSARIEAAEKLGRMGTDDAIDELINAIDENDDEVRNAIFKAIEMIGKKRVVDNLLRKAIGNVSEKDRTANILAALKNEKEEAKKMILIALKLDEKLREEIARDIDANAAKELWKMGEVAFQLIEEIAKDESKKKIIVDALASSPDEIIEAALTSNESTVRRMATDIVHEKGDYKFLPALIDSIMKEVDYSNAYKAVIAIKEKMGIKVPDNSDSKFSKKQVNILFIVPTPEIGGCFERALSSAFKKVSFTTSYSKSSELFRYDWVIVVEEKPNGPGRDLVHFLRENNVNVIYASATESDFNGISCKTLKFPTDITEILRIIQENEK